MPLVKVQAFVAQFFTLRERDSGGVPRGAWAGGGSSGLEAGCEEVDLGLFVASRCEWHLRILASIERGFDLLLRRLQLEPDIDFRVDDK